MAVPWLCVFLCLFIGLRIHPVLGAAPPFGELDDARLLPLDMAGGFAPRWYMEGTPAQPAQPLSPNPRYVLGHPLGTRQDNPCPAGQHSCVEVGAAGMCCGNDRYCYLDKDWVPKCCSLGVKCSDSQCDADQLYCNQTLSTTVAGASTTTGQQDSMVTSIVVFTTVAACCNRACNATSFSCEQAFGGRCCPYDYKCALGGNCIPDPVPSTSMFSTTVPEIPPGCTATSQFTCAQSEGGGCCDSGSICTFQSLATASSAPVCAPDPAFLEGGSSNTLSTGARAGIGVGVAVGAAIVIAVVTWLCIRRRKQHQSSTATPSTYDMRQNAWPEQGARSGTRSGVGDQDHGDSLFVGVRTPRTLWSPSAYSDTNSAPLHDYLGPDAVVGPYTYQDNDGPLMYDPGLATTPPAVSGDGAPYHPDNIVRPVEIGAGEAQEEVQQEKDNEESTNTEETPAQDEDPATGVFELMGSLGTPSPLNSDELSQPTDKGPSSSSPVGTGPK